MNHSGLSSDSPQLNEPLSSSDSGRFYPLISFAMSRLGNSRQQSLFAIYREPLRSNLVTRMIPAKSSQRYRY